MPKTRFEYFKIIKERQDYLGVRFFRVQYGAEYVTQICVDCGDVKKGKANTFGVYLITSNTFFSNYAGRYVEPCSKKEYDNQFIKMVSILK